MSFPDSPDISQSLVVQLGTASTHLQSSEVISPVRSFLSEVSVPANAKVTNKEMMRCSSASPPGARPEGMF